MCEIAINVGLLQEYSEVDISGTAAGFVKLAGRLVKNSTGIFSLTLKRNAYFPVTISEVSLELVDQSEGLIDAQIHGTELKISGDSRAFQKLAAFLESLSCVPPGGHFHLDWFSDEDLLAPTTSTMSFIFSVER
ncbi:hypothetical protein K3G63_03655 [Hymenobacter sp. HSC-4F20]|uniref:Imm32 family immunity protein n=1 Tax=Hymenobacter sp. HSC-4F20 TaxID=2864135 RepID=UPI001C7309B1|nr:hypothetical protein [Hymenobacter sp. HSC-4F20]MBX0289516.1 hypothetical protein [Hymenobacter sp. HSC-4F20]